jgi:hypothetical protein
MTEPQPGLTLAQQLEAANARIAALTAPPAPPPGPTLAEQLEAANARIAALTAPPALPAPPTLEQQLEAANARIAALTQASGQAAAAPVTPSDPALADPAVRAAYERGRAEALAEASAAHAALAVNLTGPTHWLALADGRVVEGTGAVPTHYSDDKGVVPVNLAWER